MLYSAVAQVGFVALVAVTLFAAAAGDRVARLAAGLHFANWILVALLMRRHVHHAFQTADFAVDVVGAGLAVWLAVASGRAWAGCLAACQVLGAVSYVTAFDARLAQAEVTASYLWETGALASLVWAGIASSPACDQPMSLEGGTAGLGHASATARGAPPMTISACGDYSSLLHVFCRHGAAGRSAGRDRETGP